MRQAEHKGQLLGLHKELQEVRLIEVQARGHIKKPLLEAQEAQQAEVHLQDRLEKHRQEVQEVTEAPHPQEVEEGNKNSF